MSVCVFMTVVCAGVVRVRIYACACAYVNVCVSVCWRVCMSVCNVDACACVRVCVYVWKETNITRFGMSY